MPIRVLDSTLIDQIAAGEVIERAASVVKELLENALDAGAARIEIDIERAGLGLIRIRDDGSGMDAHDLSLAVQRHATSKIASLDDLEGIASFGFRGEALPSIGAVARLRVVSRARGAEQAHEISIEGGERQAIRPAAHPPGTSVEVADLFYNVPARRKFVRSDSTEFAHIVKQVERAVLSAPAVAFRLTHNGREILELPAALDTAGIERRIDRILGPEFRVRALAIDESHGLVRLSGWLGLPTASRAQPDSQFWYVNSRAVRDRLLANAVRLGYRDVLYHGRHPSYLLYLSIDPRQVDVNAHPTKLEVRFRDGRAVHDGVFRSIERTLADTRPAEAVASATVLRSQEALPVTASLLPSMRADAPPGAGFGDSSFSAPRASGGAQPALYSRSAEAAAQALSSAVADADQPLGVAIAQLHGLYILAQNRDGLIVVDTHAAHERVLYEQLKAQYDAGTAAAQLLLTPLILAAPEHQIEALLAERAELERIGFDIERHAPERLAIRRVPVILARHDPAAVLTELARELTGDAGHGAHHLDGAAHRILGNVACRAAIRGQRTLSLAEMDALLRQMEQTDRASQCNHGRPTWMRLSLREIDQLFLRGR